MFTHLIGSMPAFEVERVSPSPHPIPLTIESSTRIFNFQSLPKDATFTDEPVFSANSLTIKIHEYIPVQETQEEANARALGLDTQAAPEPAPSEPVEPAVTDEPSTTHTIKRMKVGAETLDVIVGQSQPPESPTPVPPPTPAPAAQEVLHPRLWTYKVVEKFLRVRIVINREQFVAGHRFVPFSGQIRALAPGILALAGRNYFLVSRKDLIKGRFYVGNRISAPVETSVSDLVSSGIQEPGLGVETEDEVSEAANLALHEQMQELLHSQDPEAAPW